jgi:(4-(4-[2-(gamma-L-glutamylamino)ethyl]phenoxymethyl)furan-2-yl)methanamine synthase
MSEIATPHVLGLDIGGANLKAVHTAGVAVTQALALWRQPERLPDKLRALVRTLPPADCWAVTMTAELCDCYATKAAGVRAILQTVAETAGSTPVHVWTIKGKFLPVTQALEQPLQVASANWLALATYAGRFVSDGAALAIDCGTTTTDVIPLIGGMPTPLGWTDLDRLTYGELVYTGVERTPVCAVLHKAVWRGRDVRLAAELFATTLDAYLVLGLIPSEECTRHTADGRPRTQVCAHARLARMVCADTAEFDWSDALDFARQIRAAQVVQLQDAVRTVRFRLPALSESESILVCGTGAFLARGMLNGDGKTVCLEEKVGASLSEAACAHAVAVLGSEMM